ncbi:MAG: AAA family ATPase [Hyphomicrobiales bacterium]
MFPVETILTRSVSSPALFRQKWLHQLGGQVSGGGLVAQKTIEIVHPRATLRIMPQTEDKKQVEELHDAVLQLAQISLTSGAPQSSVSLRKLARRLRVSNPETSQALLALMKNSPTRTVATAIPPRPQPVDNESRLPLVRFEDPVILAFDPILEDSTRTSLQQLIQEHKEPSRLIDAGLMPTRTALFVGIPGVGKTLAARWIARDLGLPLISLDLASVMSSLLGRTGENVRRVLEYAKNVSCVLLLDELDAVAKRRDDATEIGELKRLVTVLLQEIDVWPDGSLLIAATNHSDLLDPAVWRRFETVVEFPIPTYDSLTKAFSAYMDGEHIRPTTLAALATLYLGASFSDVERDVMRARRNSAIHGVPIEQSLWGMTREQFRTLSRQDRVKLALKMQTDCGLSQRFISELSGVSRDTLRKHDSEPMGET